MSGNSVYDDQDERLRDLENPEWYDNTLRDIQSLPEAEDAPQSADDYKKPKQVSPDEIANKEKAGDGGQVAPTLAGETGMGEDDKLGRGYQAGSGAKATGRFAGLMTKRNAGVGGVVGGVAGAFIMFTFFGSSLYLVHIRENLLGRSNPIFGAAQSARETRRANSAVHDLGKVGSSINQEKFIKKMEAAGFDVKTSVTGKVTEIAKDGRTLDVDTRIRGTMNRRVKEFFSGEAGGKLLKEFNAIAPEGAARAVGRVTKTKVIKPMGITAFIDWIGARKGLSEATTPKAQFADALANAGPSEKAAVEANVDTAKLESDNASSASARDIDGNEIDGANDGVADPRDAFDGDIAEQAAEYDEAVRTSNGAQVVVGGIDDATREAAEGVLGESGEAIADDALRGAGETTLRTSAAQVSTKVGAELGAKISSRLVKSVGGLNLAEVPRHGCRLKGTLNFVQSVRNVMIATELAAFAVRFLTIADHQKAGAIQSESIKIMGIYMGGATASGGLQRLMGNPTASVSATDLTRNSIGRSNSGVIGTISRFLEKVPGVNSTTVCKLSNNFFVGLGATVAGGLIGFLSGGSSIAVSISLGIGLTVLEELAYAIFTPMIIKAVAGQVMSGYESPEMAGGALAAGFGAYAAMSSSANVGLPTTKPEAAALRYKAQQEHKRDIASRSVFERYFDIETTDSLLGKLAFGMPKSSEQTMNTVASLPLSGLNPLATLGSSLSGSSQSLFGSDTAFAESLGAECTDPQMVKYNIETDAYCNPLVATIIDIDLDNTEDVLKREGLIDASGQPTDKTPSTGNKSFSEWVKLCASGRAGLMYNYDVKTDGTNNPTDDTCVKTGAILAGDVPEFFEEPETPDTRSWIAKKLSPRALAETPAGETRIPGTYERYASWYGYLADTANLSDEINDAFSPVTSNDSGTTGASIAGFTGPVIPCEPLPKTVVPLRDGNDWSQIPPTGSIGKNSAGEDINVYVRDACPGQTNVRTVIIGSSIHGTENGGQRITHELLFNKDLPPDVRIIAIPEINKWGIANGARLNKNGVNLNRNFDFGWNSAGGTDDNPNPGNPEYKGASPASEPETKAIQDFLLNVGKSSLVISYHDCLNWASPSGPKNRNESYLVARKYVSLAPITTITCKAEDGPVTWRALGNNTGYGFFEAWYNNATETPAMLVELTNSRSEDYIGRHVDALAQLLNEGFIK